MCVGKTVKHQFAKELLAGFVGGEVDKLVEVPQPACCNGTADANIGKQTKGLDWVDAEKAKHQGREKAEQMYDQHYGDMDEYNPNARDRPHHIRDN